MEKTTSVTSKKVPAREVLGHALGGFGQNMVYALWSGFITAFYTDVFGMDPFVMAGIFFVGRVWDTINDPLMGILADRGHSRFGRYRCWLGRMPVVVAVCLVLNFTVPNFGTVGNTVYAAVTYILMATAFTTVDISYWSLPAAMTGDPQERTKIFTTANLGTNIASTVGNMLIPILLVNFGGTTSPRAYQITAIIFGIIGAVFYLTCFGLVREHITPPPSSKFSFKLAIKALVTNRPLVCIIVANFVLNFAFILKMNLNYYYTTYTLGDVQLMSIMSLVTLPTIIIGTILAPFVAKKLGKHRTLITMMICEFAVSAVFFFGGHTSIPFILVMGGLQVLCVGSSFVLLTSMTADTIEYAEWKTGQRNEGVITSTRTLITNLASAVVGVGVAAVLTLTGYVPNVEQTVQTQEAFHFVVSFMPGIVMMIGVIPMFFYPLGEKKYAQIVEDLKKRHEQQEA